MRHKLTDRYLQSLKPPATGRLDIVDTEARGLVMRVTANGVKSWAIRYSPKGIGQRRASYGRYPDTKLAEARQPSPRDDRRTHSGPCDRPWSG